MFWNLISDKNFLSWLANKLDYFPSGSNTLMNHQEKVFLQYSCLPKDVLREIYHFWIKNSISSRDKRSGRNEINIIKLKYMQIHERILDFEDENIREFTKIKKK